MFLIVETDGRQPTCMKAMGEWPVLNVIPLLFSPTVSEAEYRSDQASEVRFHPGVRPLRDSEERGV